jgi:hypothetical protein
MANQRLTVPRDEDQRLVALTATGNSAIVIVVAIVTVVVVVMIAMVTVGKLLLLLGGRVASVRGQLVRHATRQRYAMQRGNGG